MRIVTRMLAVGALHVGAGAAAGQCELDKIFADDGTAFENFGTEVALHGDTIVSGVPMSGADNAGAAYVYERAGVEWAQSQKLIGSDMASNDRFGFSVAIDGDTLMVGAHLADAGLGDAGKVYVFERVGDGWVEQQVLQSPSPVFQGQFGYDIAIDGDRAVVSEIWASVDSQAAAGALHVFERAAGAWALADTIESPGPAAFDQLGISADVDGDAIIAGEVVGQGQNAAGRVRIFERAGDAWVPALAFDSPEGVGTGLGIDVAIEGDHALASAPLAEADVGIFAGEVYAFRRELGAWAFETTVRPEEHLLAGQFGAGLDIDTGMAVVGANGVGVGGTAYLFRLVDGAWYEVTKTEASDAMSADAYGVACAIDQPLGVVGALFADGQVASTGAAYVIETLTLRPGFEIDPDVSEVVFGITIGDESDMAAAHPLGVTTADLTEGCVDFSTLQVTEMSVSSVEDELTLSLPLIELVYVEPEIILAPGRGTPPSPGELVDGFVSQDDGLFTFGGTLEYNVMGVEGTLDMTDVEPQPFFMDVTLGEGGALNATFEFGQEIVVDFGLGDLNPVMDVAGTAVGTAQLGGCYADCDANGELNILDFVCFQQLFQSGDPSADCDGNGDLSILDFVCFQQAFQAGCP